MQSKLRPQLTAWALIAQSVANTISQALSLLENSCRDLIRRNAALPWAWRGAQHSRARVPSSQPTCSLLSSCSRLVAWPASIRCHGRIGFRTGYQAVVRQGIPTEVRIRDSIVMVSDGGGVREPLPGFLYVYVEDADAAYRMARARHCAPRSSATPPAQDRCFRPPIIFPG